MRAVFVDIKIQIGANLLLEELEGDLGHDALQLPAGALIEFADLLVAFGLSLEFWSKISFQDLLEEGNPRCELAWLCEVWTYNNL